MEDGHLGEGGPMWNTGGLGVRIMTSVTGCVKFITVYGRHPIGSDADAWISESEAQGRTLGGQRTSSTGMQDKKK